LSRTAARARPIVAIDGPAGTGKSTVARAVAEAVGYTYIDTGAMYRAVALACRREGVSVDDEDEATRVCEALALRFVRDPDGTLRLLADGADVSEAIRSPEASDGSSRVSVHPGVRADLVRRQREMGRDGGVVMEGRDIQTNVFPDAEVKVFLTASPEERAHRRFLQLGETGVTPPPYEEILAEIMKRDARDSGRDTAPLAAADDAVFVDTDGLPVEHVVESVVELVRAAEREAQE